MEPTNETMTTPSENQSTMPWAEVAGASAAAEREGKNSRRITDVLQVPVTPAIEAKIARENAADDLSKQDLAAVLEDLKEKVKNTKGKIDVIETRMSERHEAVRSGVQTIKGEFILTDIFERNAVQYTDPDTGVVVLERPMSTSERQQELDLSRSGGDDSSPDSSDEGDDEDEAGDDEPDSDGTSITDPDALLQDATDED